MDKRLSQFMQGRIVQVLGRKGCFVNHAVARVVSADDMLLD
jgi:hypothetical protein